MLSFLVSNKRNLYFKRFKVGNCLSMALAGRPEEMSTHAYPWALAARPLALPPQETWDRAREMAGMQNLTMVAWLWGHFTIAGPLILGQSRTSHCSQIN